MGTLGGHSHHSGLQFNAAAATTTATWGEFKGNNNKKLPMLTSSSNWQCRLLNSTKLHPHPPTVLVATASITSQLEKPSSYSSTLSTDIPLYEIPGASFDQYLEDKPRVFEAIFPDKRRSQQLNQEEWRIQMLPIQFLFLRVWPVIDMRLRCKTKGMDQDYPPPGIPPHVSKVLQLQIIRWQLQGLDDAFKPSHFTLGVKGALYPDRRGTRSRLKGDLELSISFILPSMLALVPENVRRDVVESVLKGLLENMRHQVNGSLLADYNKFKREKSKNVM